MICTKVCHERLKDNCHPSFIYIYHASPARRWPNYIVLYIIEVSSINRPFKISSTAHNHESPNLIFILYYIASYTISFLRLHHTATTSLNSDTPSLPVSPCQVRKQIQIGRRIWKILTTTNPKEERIIGLSATRTIGVRHTRPSTSRHPSQWGHFK